MAKRGRGRPQLSESEIANNIVMARAALNLLCVGFAGPAVFKAVGNASTKLPQGWGVGDRYKKREVGLGADRVEEIFTEYVEHYYAQQLGVDVKYVRRPWESPVPPRRDARIFVFQLDRRAYTRKSLQRQLPQAARGKSVSELAQALLSNSGAWPKRLLDPPRKPDGYISVGDRLDPTPRALRRALETAHFAPRIAAAPRRKHLPLPDRLLKLIGAEPQDARVELKRALQNIFKGDNAIGQRGGKK